MAQPGCREIVLLNSTLTTSTNSGNMVMPQGFTSAILTCNVNTVSGSNPTLNVYIQNVLPQAASTDLSSGTASGTAIFDDLISFAQVTTSSTIQMARIVGGGNVMHAQQDGSLAAGSFASGPIGGTWRVKTVLTGTSPSFATSVVCEFIP
jgi:hypothetical protein